METEVGATKTHRRGRYLGTGRRETPTACTLVTSRKYEKRDPQRLLLLKVSVSPGHPSPAKLLIRVFPRLYRRISAPRAARPRAMDTETPRWQQAFSTATVYTNSTCSDLHLPLCWNAHVPYMVRALVRFWPLTVTPLSLSVLGHFHADQATFLTPPRACSRRAALIGIGIEREKVKKRWLLPHRYSFELMLPTPAYLFALGGRLWGYRGKRVGEATNPGPPKEPIPPTAQSTSRAPIRWSRRPTEAKCPECRTPLVSTDGRVFDLFSDKFSKQTKSQPIPCFVIGPRCEATIMAADKKYTCTKCGSDVCQTCFEGLLNLSQPNNSQSQETSSGSATARSSGWAAPCRPPC